MTFQPVDHTLSLTKVEAATRQVQFAIGALLAGAYDAAITLAGAAEDMLEGSPEIEVTSSLINDVEAQKTLGRKFWIEIVNLERNWLKHKTDQLPDTMELTLANTPFYIFRAIRKLPLSAITEEMLSFELWYRERIDREIAQRSD